MILVALQLKSELEVMSQKKGVCLTLNKSIRMIDRPGDAMDPNYFTLNKKKACLDLGL